MRERKELALSTGCRGVARVGQARSIWFIWLVSFNQTQGTDQIDQLNKTDWQLGIWDLPINQSQPSIGKVSVDLRETPASVKLSDRQGRGMCVCDHGVV
jgi:hypothetical protein